jgi:integrase/recombinase XerD
LMSNGMLRRSEAVLLRFSDLKERDGHHVLEVVGKGAKTRGVKLSPVLSKDIRFLQEQWGDGAILRPLIKRKKQPTGHMRIGDLWAGKSMSSQALYNLVIKYGKMIGRQLQPHDLRRTGAQIAWKAGVPIEQISLALGHESIETTSLYLGIERDWEKQPADFIPY